MNKIVYNACHGGFSLSEAAVKKMAKLGCQWATIALNDSYSHRVGHFLRDIDGTKAPSRHDKILVQVVEELGKEAGGWLSNLKIEVISGNKYKIDEYDGYESVETKQEWVTIK